MIGLNFLYGLGGLCAILLLAYLVYALICAEEF
jgi:K+-transporting ATPase ATPase F chain